MTIFLAFTAAWVAWAVSWFVAALWSSRPARRAGVGAEASYRVITLVGAVMLFLPGRRLFWTPRLWDVGWTGAWILVAIAVAGFAFCWWARIHLGALWSGSVTRKPDHRIVDSGPYGLVRHPIYTGILLAIFATAIAKGTVLAIAGAVVMTLGFYVKARLEERFLGAELGAAAYDAYRRRVPMLVPFLR
ncbi:MAG TPA: isoprenylcysteine carboxylmethyltransferase family protein [Hyphomicrobiales bacterium]|nr:isoprenylcysteine carboxylmethyltransferase family protein [Hyphomicrobiales bacterium]